MLVRWQLHQVEDKSVVATHVRTMTTVINLTSDSDSNASDSEEFRLP